MGPFLTWWDRLAGTWVSPEEPAPTAYGPAISSSANPVTVELSGWVALVAGHSSASRRARRKTATCAATMTNGAATPAVTLPLRMAATEPRQ